MKFIETRAGDIPFDLLLEADPSEQSVRSYLDSGLVFAAVRNKAIVGVCVVALESETRAELFNISVSKAFQKQGVGTKLLEFVLGELRLKGIRRVELGTGTFGYQLAYYQRQGFRVGSVIKDYFVNRYPAAIYEQGIQLKDMLRLYLDL
ncbi:Acetyltransferases [Alteromonadaceae bacterium Bs31]|nr:Acetyltransferases [Alteromonadaceae bacterium Bs31]